ncbi:MAG TPA: response regulator [Silvibacterium sp.]|nr:response regulator [Silvibacterium sp.]
MPGLGQNHRVLIIDDAPNVSDTLALIFSKNGYDARVAYSAEQAIEIIAEWEPDLAIVDVVLPQMNGIDLALVLKANHPACRVLLFSGEEITADLVTRAANEGNVFEVLAKPVHPAFILETAANLLASNPKGYIGNSA